MIDVREKLAEYAHEAWSGWMEYMFSKCFVNRQGDCVIPREYWKALQRQVNTSYEDLTEKEKDGDRYEADKMIKIFKNN